MSAPNTIKNAFKKAAAYYFSNAERVTGWSYNLGTSILLGKNFFDPLMKKGTMLDLETYSQLQTYTNMANMDTVAALLFLASGLCIAKSMNKPSLFKTAGHFTIIGSFALAAGGWGEAGFWQHSLGILPSAIGGILMQLDQKGQDIKTEEGSIKAAFQKIRRHNRIFMGTIESASRPFHAWAGVLQGDIGQVIYSASWLIGDLSTIASDKNIQDKALQALEHKKRPHAGSFQNSIK